MKTMLIIYKCQKKFKLRDAEKLRGYIGNLYIDDDRFHNHYTNGKDKYRMPKVIYSVRNGNFNIISYNDEEGTLLKEIFRENELLIGEERITNFEKELKVIDQKFNVSNKIFKYKFKTMWIGLNKKNYEAYRKKEIDLNKLLRNQILANFSGLGIRIDKEIMILGKFKKAFTEIKKQKMIGFYGEFQSNVNIPKYMSFGKRKSIGYGEVEKID